MSSIKISVITVTQNCNQTVTDCISSVATQTFKNHEHIIVDGASTDGTLDTLMENANHFSRLISEPDDGIYHALNKGLGLATGEVVGFLHADDFYAHRHVLTHVAEAFADPTVCAVFGDLQYVSAIDPTKVIRKWVSSPFTSCALAKGWMPPHPTLYVRKQFYRNIGGFDTNYLIAADYDSMLKLFNLPEFKSNYLPEVMVKMRLGGVSNRSLKNIFLKTLEDYKILRKSKFGMVNSLIILFYKNFFKIKQFLV
jgi:glycosyltransferase